MPKIIKDEKLIPMSSANEVLNDDIESKEENEIIFKILKRIENIENHLEDILYSEHYDYEYEIMMYQQENDFLKKEILYKNKLIRQLEENILYLKKNHQKRKRV